jgi:hypothetical protein
MEIGRATIESVLGEIECRARPLESELRRFPTESTEDPRETGPMHEHQA